jgi:mannose-6-phosphate isomerase
LAAHLNKACGPLSAAESWEIVDHGEYQSFVKYGDLKGRSLNQLLQEFGPQLVGYANWESISKPSIPPTLRGRFPLLLKFLDANQALSIQVHPDDAYASTLEPPDLGKTEAWYVMHAECGAKIYSGLKEGVTPSDFKAALAAGTTAELMYAFEPQVGDVIFIQAGTMHALGAGLLVAEIQQASNTTFRVFDWNRVDANGVARPLHIQQALSVTRFDLGPIGPCRNALVTALQQPGLTKQKLISGDKFTLWHNRLQSDLTHSLGQLDSFRILVVTSGELILQHDPAGTALKTGDTALIPAKHDLVLTSQRGATEFLEITA